MRRKIVGGDNPGGGLCLTLALGDGVHVDGPCDLQFYQFSDEAGKIWLRFKAPKTTKILRANAKVKHDQT